ncbi:16944_t:CDS:2, partial [Funneliformis geosporum]
LEIVQEVFGSLPEKTMDFEFFDVSKIATPNKFSPSKLLNPDEYLEDDDLEEDLKDFTVVTKATPFAVTTHSKVSVRHFNLTHSVVVYFAMSDAATAALHVTIPDLKIDTF